MGRRIRHAPEKPLSVPRLALGRWLPVALLTLLTLSATDCYSTGDGTAPPLDQLYYPVGLQVSAGGTVLYAVNSDFDLQYNGGTLQSYDLSLLRQHVKALIADPTALEVPFLDRAAALKHPCPLGSDEAGASSRDPTATLGETCAPPVDSSFYVRDSAVIGAFATELLLSLPPSRLESKPGDVGGAGNRSFDRLFSALRGNASVTWANVDRDLDVNGKPTTPPAIPLGRKWNNTDEPYQPFVLQCGQEHDTSRRCDGAHEGGNNANELNNTRHITMPGEPFGMTMSRDGEAIIITHQNETKTSLFDSGLRRSDNGASPPPSLQFILDGVPLGGVGVAAIPHDPAAFLGTATLPHPAFLETSRQVAQVSLIRQYPDEFNGLMSALKRPFLNQEGAYAVAVGPGGNDSRGIVIDPTPRLACKAKVAPKDESKGRTQTVLNDENRACGRKAARVFIANRSPPSLLIGDIGGSASAETNYDPDRLVLHTTIPLSAGPSKLYLAPVVEADGALALRVFAVCFDSATVFVYNPETEQLENVIRVGLGPFAMAFDPFTFEDVAAHKKVESAFGLRRYRFAYLASFTRSFIQILDLDNVDHSATFERVVYTLGLPKNPKGS